MLFRKRRALKAIKQELMEQVSKMDPDLMTLCQNIAANGRIVDRSQDEMLNRFDIYITNPDDENYIHPACIVIKRVAIPINETMPPVEDNRNGNGTHPGTYL